MKMKRAPITDSAAETWLAGGLSIVVSLGFWLFVDRDASVVGISNVAFTLAFVCNHPHFLSSYVLLYGDYGDRLWRRPRYAWAGIAAPLALFAGLTYALAATDAALMAWIITLMYFLVGWHYVKQVFGCVVVSHVRREIFLTKLERRLLVINLFGAWFMSWLNAHVRPARYEFYGIAHQSLELPRWTLTIVYVWVAISLFAVVGSQVARYVRTGLTAPAPAIAAFVALYAWYLPTMAHPSFAYLIPFFHSLQYLVLVGRLKSNQLASQVTAPSESARRLAWVKGIGGFALAALGLGALTFQSLPAWLDRHHVADGVGLGTAPMMAAFILFINIHHYFIDNVIWRSDNETVRAHLFGRGSSVPRASHPAYTP